MAHAYYDDDEYDEGVTRPRLTRKAGLFYAPLTYGWVPTSEDEAGEEEM